MLAIEDLLYNFYQAHILGDKQGMENWLQQANRILKDKKVDSKMQVKWVRAQMHFHALASHKELIPKKLIGSLKQLKKKKVLQPEDYLLVLHTPLEDKETILKEALMAFPLHPGLIGYQSRQLINTGNSQEAIWYLLQALFFSKGESSLLILLQEARLARWKEIADLDAKKYLEEKILLALATQQGEQAISLLDQIDENSGITPSKMGQYRASAFALNHQWKEAQKIWDDQLKDNSISLEAALIHARKYIQAGYPEYGYEILQRFVPESPIQVPDLVEEFDAGKLFPQTYFLELQIALYYLMAESLRMMGRLPESQQWLNQALEARPQDAELLLCKALIASANQEMEDAFFHLLEAKKAGLDPKTWGESRAELYFQLKDWEKLVEILEPHHIKYSRNARTSFLLGIAYFHLGNNQFSIIQLQETTSKFGENPDRPQALYTLHLLFLKQHFIGDAAAMMKQLLAYYPKENPNHRPFALLLATLLYDNKSFDEASELFMSLHQEEPLERPYRSYLEVLVNFECAKIDGTDLTFSTENTYIAEPQNPRQIIHNANVGVVLDQNDMAAKYFEQGADTGFWPEFYLKKAFNLAYKGKHWELMISIYEKWKKLNPTAFDDHFDGAYAYALYQLGRYAEARKVYNDLFYTYPTLKSGKNMTSVWSNTLARAYYQLGEHDLAKRYIQIYCGQAETIHSDFQAMLKDIVLKEDQDDIVNQHLQYDTALICGLDLTEEEKISYQRLRKTLDNQLLAK